MINICHFVDDFTQSTLQVHKGSMGGLSKKRTPLLWKTLSAFIKTSKCGEEDHVTKDPFHQRCDCCLFLSDLLSS